VLPQVSEMLVKTVDVMGGGYDIEAIPSPVEMGVAPPLIVAFVGSGLVGGSAG